MSSDFEFLTDKTRTEQEMQFLDDDMEEHNELKASEEDSDSAKVSVSIIDVIFEILRSHARGIEFREWNAGERIDA